jgi:hypothetical protein
MAAERNFFHRWWGSSTIGSDTNAIWGMSDQPTERAKLLCLLAQALAAQETKFIEIL